jgi:tricarballylate dehydrogenase
MNIARNTDVLVVGGGNAALCAAIAAREQGAEVLVLEHAGPEMRGGNTRHTRNLRAAHAGPVATLSGSYPEEEFWNDLLRVTGGHTDETLARLMIHESESLLGWLQARGVHFQPALSGTLGLERTNAFFLGGGKAMLDSLYRAARSRGIRIHYGCEVTGLRLDGRRAVTAALRGSEGEESVAAAAVVVASGGFQANTAWMREVWGEAADNFVIRGTPFNRGTVLRDLLDQGAAAVGDPSQCHAIAVDARAPSFDGGIVTRLDCICFSLVVNREGRRFHDEGEDLWPKRYAIWGRLIAEQPGQLAYAVFDARVRDNFMPSVFPGVSATSLRELAEAIGVEPARLEATVDEFNRAVRHSSYDPGVLDGCRTEGLSPPKSHWALPLDTPPYYAYPLKPGITFTYLGLKVDENAAVVFGDGEASANIFAAGEVMAGNVLGQGYCAGTGMTIGGVFGRIAGENAARSAAE